MKKVFFCYSLLKMRLFEKKCTQTKLAQYIGLSETMLGRKLNRGLPFKSTHIRSICERLEIRPEEIGRYFFNVESDHNEP